MAAAGEWVLEVEAEGRFDALYRQHAPTALRVAYLLTGDRALAQDLVQDAFVKLAGKFLDLRDPEAFGAYLVRTVTSLANSHFRRRRLERAHNWVDASALAPPEGTDQVDAREMLWEALGTLPGRQRSAIVLRYYRDAADAEVARILGCRPGTVRSLISRGLQALRAEVDRG